MYAYLGEGLMKSVLQFTSALVLLTFQSNVMGTNEIDTTENKKQKVLREINEPKANLLISRKYDDAILDYSLKMQMLLLSSWIEENKKLIEQIPEIFDRLNSIHNSANTINLRNVLSHAHMIGQKVNQFIKKFPPDHIFILFLRSKGIVKFYSGNGGCLSPQRLVFNDEKKLLSDEFFYLKNIYKILESGYNKENKELFENPFIQFLILDKTLCNTPNGDIRFTEGISYEDYFWAFNYFEIETAVVKYSENYEEIQDRLKTCKQPNADDEFFADIANPV